MVDLLLGAAAILALQTVGAALMHLSGDRDGWTYLAGVTAWPVWAPLHLAREHRRDRAAQARRKRETSRG